MLKLKRQYFSHLMCIYLGGFLGGSMVKKKKKKKIHLPMQETWAQSLGWEDTQEKEMATHSRVDQVCTCPLNLDHRLRLPPNALCFFAATHSPTPARTPLHGKVKETI